MLVPFRTDPFKGIQHQPPAGKPIAVIYAKTLPRLANPLVLEGGYAFYHAGQGGIGGTPNPLHGGFAFVAKESPDLAKGGHQYVPAHEILHLLLESIHDQYKWEFAHPWQVFSGGKYSGVLAPETIEQIR